MASFLQKLRGSPDEDEIKKRADASAAKYEAETGQKPAEEEGLVEGDMSDYVMPFKGLGKNILKAVANKGLKEAGKVAIKEGAKIAAKEGAETAEQAALDYSGIAFRPSKTITGATTGWGGGRNKMQIAQPKKDYLNNKTKLAEAYADSDSRIDKAYRKNFQKAKTFGKDPQPLAERFKEGKLNAEIDYLNKVEKHHPKEFAELQEYLVDETRGQMGPSKLRKKLAETTQHYNGIQEVLEELRARNSD